MRKIIELSSFLLLIFSLFGCVNDGDDVCTGDDCPCVGDHCPCVGDECEEPVYPGTFNRQHASYYEPGVPLIEDGHVVYMNFDGFAYYYYDEFIREQLGEYTPTLSKIIEEGIKFEDLRTTFPSITNPCQNMILSGATSAVTRNVYRYYSLASNTVYQQERENASKTIIDLALEQDMSVASVSQYLAESKLSVSDPTKLYINPDNTNPKVVARGASHYGDHFSRFEQLIKLIKGEQINTGGGLVTVTELPNLTLFYADDLDAIGHNEKDSRGYTRATSEEQRMRNILTALKDIDLKLADFIAEAKKNGTYDKLTFFLTTDHGMTPFGYSSSDDKSDNGRTKFGELVSDLKKFDTAYSTAMVAAGGSPSASTNVVAVGMNLNVQLTFRKGITDERLDELKAYLLTKDYIANVYTREELKEHGYWVNDTDMIITPAGRYCFSGQILATYNVRGQHDSTLESANKIFGVIWGKGIKKGAVYQETAYNYDFGTTMAACLGLQFPNANGIVLDVFERE